MKYAVLFDSRTGNTALIAEEIRSTLKQERCVGFGMQPLTGTADVVFLGSWCNRGGFSEEMRKVISGIHHQKVALFATCGYGMDRAYFQRIEERMKEQAGADNDVLAAFVCQGKMPVSVRHRYEELLKDEKMKDAARAMIANFDHALSHPDETDLKQAEAFALRVAAMIDAV